MRPILWVVAVASVGCTHLRSLSVTTIPEDRSRPVSAAAQRTIVLGINADNDYAKTLVQDLAKQCPNGTVSGVVTRYERSMVVPIFAYANRVYAEGYCVVEPEDAVNTVETVETVEPGAAE